jgi:hypothetical protein
MLQTRSPGVSENVPKSRQEEQLGLPDTIFAGLTFPAVPTNVPTITRPAAEESTVKIDSKVESVPPPAYDTIAVKKEISSHVEITKETEAPTHISATRKISLEKLYTPDDAITSRASSSYPSLPELGPVNIASKSITHTVKSPSSVHSGEGVYNYNPITHTGQDIEDERSSLLGADSNSRTANTPTRPGGTIMKPTQYMQNLMKAETKTQNYPVAAACASPETKSLPGAADALVTELMDENARLHQEVMNLQTELEVLFFSDSC